MMVYLRQKKIRGHNYYYIVEGNLVKGKVKQKVIFYIGTADTLLKKLQLLNKFLKKKY